ncbi:MAG: AI-2E family transporter [Lachnospiraceae bacterium]|nr:AI-2E family transporter [Lachnospiraceae bacterium]MBQ6196480.1 AI-2E family transporter [Lachnospiraceae bacterium]
MHRFKDEKWYPAAVAIVIGVVAFVLLNHFGGIIAWFRKILGYFSPVILGIILAYIINPLSKFYENLLFGKSKTEKKRHIVSNILAFISVILILALILFLLIPQLFESVSMFATNLDDYMRAVRDWISRLGIAESIGNLQEILNSSENLIKKLVEIIQNNFDKIISGTASAGKSVFNWVIAFILSIYTLAEKDQLKNTVTRLLKAGMSDARYEKLSVFIRKCDMIFEQYVSHNFLDSLIVGVITAIFMACFGMPYIGLISVVVAFVNLIPTFGPFIGEVLGAFILFFVKPWYALAFFICELTLQVIDGYVIKPKLFGTSLGVSGLLILAGIVVGGRMFGVVGILLAIPFVAILDMLFNEYFIVWLERKKKLKQDARTLEENKREGFPGDLNR